MNEALTKRLYKKYPKFLKQKDLPMSQTAMCWGIDCSDSWYCLLDKTIAKIVKVCPEASASQIKEKFGTLRIYMASSNEAAERIVDKALEQSATICEICGNKGRVVELNHWYSVLCRPCEKESRKRGLRELWGDQAWKFARGAYKKK